MRYSMILAVSLALYSDVYALPLLGLLNVELPVENVIMGARAESSSTSAQSSTTAAPNVLGGIINGLALHAVSSTSSQKSSSHSSTATSSSALVKVSSSSSSKPTVQVGAAGETAKVVARATTTSKSALVSASAKVAVSSSTPVNAGLGAAGETMMVHARGVSASVGVTTSKLIAASASIGLRDAAPEPVPTVAISVSGHISDPKSTSVPIGLAASVALRAISASVGVNPKPTSTLIAASASIVLRDAAPEPVPTVAISVSGHISDPKSTSVPIGLAASVALRAISASASVNVAPTATTKVAATGAVHMRDLAALTLPINVQVTPVLTIPDPSSINLKEREAEAEAADESLTLALPHSAQDVPVIFGINL